MKRRSFAFTAEHESKLNDIQNSKDFSSRAAAMRFCVEYTFEGVMYQVKPELPILVQKNHILLRYLLIEAVKTHGGKTNSSQAVEDYLSTLNREITEHIQEVMGKLEP
jgi:hypothetical protein